MYLVYISSVLKNLLKRCKCFSYLRVLSNHLSFIDSGDDGEGLIVPSNRYVTERGGGGLKTENRYDALHGGRGAIFSVTYFLNGP